jgi:hypothetical protein
VVDKGFEGEDNHRRWLDRYGTRVICPPKRDGRKRSWPKRLRRWAASIRQIVETVYEKLYATFGLRGERRLKRAARFRPGEESPHDVATATKYFALRSVARRYRQLSEEISELGEQLDRLVAEKQRRNWSPSRAWTQRYGRRLLDDRGR